VVTPEDLPLFTDERTCGNGGEFAVSIWLVESPMRDVQAAQPIKATKKLAFIGNANDDEMRVLIVRGKKRFADFKNSVARLDDLLGNRQVGSDEDISVGSVVLRESHDKLPRGSSNFPNHTHRE